MLDFHDSTLLEIKADWVQGTCCVILKHHTGMYKVMVNEFYSISAPRVLPWGFSNSINKLVIQASSVQIEMQSGDTITISGNVIEQTTFFSQPFGFNE